MTKQLAHHPQRRAFGRDDAAGFERLDEADCWSLLSEASVGRVGVVVDGAAEIYPVNFVVDRSTGHDPTIVFRTDPGTKLAALAGTPRVSFEVDHLDLVEHTGWSVVVKGRARQIRELPDADERDRVRQLPVETWDVAPKRHWVRIEPTEVTGRRIGPLTTRRLARRGVRRLPSVAEWTAREVWVPPCPVGARP